MKYYKKVQGERVFLSPLSIDDVDVLTEWLNTPQVMDNIGGNYYNNNLISCKEWFEKKLKDERACLFAIVKDGKNDSELIGYFEFMETDYIHRTATFCVFIGDEENRGKGYGTEAVMLGVKYGFDVLNLNNIDLKVYSFNERAARSYAKVGFKEYGRRRRAYYLNNEYHDIIYMDIIREDFYDKCD
ncbi:MAG: GNAT family N-acetyltransferase [Oscillospiraceae bacterium]|nr:GNAT family N-acetyltransferase [Oscillospiraceae bacterium]